MKKAIKETVSLDFSKGKPNKFYGRRLVVVGDPRRRNPGGKLFEFLNTRNNRSVRIHAANKANARLIFLERFGLTRMPAGFEIIEMKVVA